MGNFLLIAKTCGLERADLQEEEIRLKSSQSTPGATVKGYGGIVVLIRTNAYCVHVLLREITGH